MSKLIINGKSYGVESGDKITTSDVVNNLLSESTRLPLSANQGRILDGKVKDVNAKVDELITKTTELETKSIETSEKMTEIDTKLVSVEDKVTKTTEQLGGFSFVKLTQSQYDALSSHPSTTVYFIVG